MYDIEPTKPGEILQEEFLIPMHISAYKLSKDTNIPQSRISEIISGKRGISADTAARLSAYFGTSPEFWMNVQNQYELDMLKVSGEFEKISRIKPYRQQVSA